MEIQQNYQLSQLTTFGIGGPADFFVAIRSVEELKEALSFAREKNLPVLVLGRGSNILISDEGFRGLVIQNKILGLLIEDSGRMAVGAGENWDDVVAQAIEKKLAGIECLSGIPGSAGGSVVQNIGAYGQTIGDLVTEVEAMDAATGAMKKFSASDCQFAYRTSWFKENLNKFIITKFFLQLKPDGAPTMTYADVKKYFEGKPQPDLRQVRDCVIQIRAAKGYLIQPGFESYNTAGSYFKNPVVTFEDFERLKAMLGDESANRYWRLPKGVKIAAAFLMQEAGFGKGYREGHVGISPKHSLSLVNFGGASANEVKALAEKIKKTVMEKFGVVLEEEVLYV